MHYSNNTAKVGMDMGHSVAIEYRDRDVAAATAKTADG